jgi:hypothetical protein
MHYALAEEAVAEVAMVAVAVAVVLLLDGYLQHQLVLLVLAVVMVVTGEAPFIVI